jgi:serine/threonine-protein kinase
MSALSVALFFVGASAAAADPPKQQKAGTAATAQSLFYEARNLMRDGNYAAACPKLEESLRLEHGMGTEFNLADCNEKLGKIASAWSGYTNVAAEARAQNQWAREKVATERAAALEARLPKLAIDLMEDPPADLVVKRDGLVVGAASYNIAMPVDPGSHQLSTSASGYQPWDGAITAPEGKVVRITLPPLVPVVAAAPSAPPSSATAGPPADAPQPLAAPFPEPIVERRSAQRTIGWVLGGAGLATVGIGLLFGLDSLRKHDAAKSHCTGDLCDQRGVDLRDQAISSGTVATILGIAGGGAVAAGAVLVLAAPRSAPRKELGTRALFATPHVATNGAGLSLQGVFQ